ncbi:MAG: ABC transporter permease, partial [Acidobacteria bacterium]|nr:ABC transporter permease [Acidobacteriota bacterium]
LLTIMADICGMIGGYVAEVAISGMSWELYLNRPFSLIEFSDLIPATRKTMAFGMIIGTVACYLGFTTTQGTESVGRTSTRSVVLSSILIIVANVVLVRLIFFLFPPVA